MSATYKITARDIDAFTHGDCWALAQNISAKTGWLAYAVGVYPEHVDEGMSRRLDRFDWVHVIVQTPSGLYLDVTGTITSQELIDDYVHNIAPASGVEVDVLDFEPVDTAEKWRNVILDLVRAFPDADVDVVADTLILNYYTKVAPAVYSFGTDFNCNMQEALASVFA